LSVSHTANFLKCVISVSRFQPRNVTQCRRCDAIQIRKAFARCQLFNIIRELYAK